MARNKRKKVRVNLNLYEDQLVRLKRLVELDDEDMSCRIRKWIDEKLGQVFVEEVKEEVGQPRFDII